MTTDFLIELGGCICNAGHAPCSFCTGMNEEQAEAWFSGGMQALKDLRNKEDVEMTSDELTVAKDKVLKAERITAFIKTLERMSVNLPKSKITITVSCPPNTSSRSTDDSLTTDQNDGHENYRGYANVTIMRALAQAAIVSELAELRKALAAI